MAKEPMEEELEIVPTPSKEGKTENINGPVTVIIDINDRPDLMYTFTAKDVNYERNRIIYEMNKDEIAEWNRHNKNVPCPMRIILPKLPKDRVLPEIRLFRNRDHVPEDDLTAELEKSFERIDKGEDFDPIFMPPGDVTPETTINSLYDVVYEEPAEEGEPAVLKSVTPKGGQKVPRVIIRPDALEVSVSIPVLETNVDELGKIDLNTTNSKKLKLKIIGGINSIEFVAEDRDRMYFKKSSFRIGSTNWTSSKSFNKWIVANKEDPEYYHDVHAKLEGKVSYQKKWEKKDPYKSKSEELRKMLNDIRSKGSKEEAMAEYNKKDREFKDTFSKLARSGVPEFRHARPQRHKVVLIAEFSYVEEDTMHAYSRDGYESDLKTFKGQDWAKYTTFKKSFANKVGNKLQEPLDATCNRFSVKIEVLEYEGNKYVTITGKMPDRESFKKFVNIFKQPVKRIVIEVDPLNETELAEIGTFKRSSSKTTAKTISEAEKRAVEEAREKMYESLLGAPAQKNELELVSGTAGSGMEEVPIQPTGEPGMHKITQEEFDLLSPEEKDNYNIWADEKGFETYF